MTLELLRTFQAVVRQQGMRRAAEVLHVSQPAVSQRIRELESLLQVRLFERRGRGLLLTSSGQVLLEESRALLAAAEALQRRLAPLRGLQRGTLRLATIDAASIYLLPEIYLEFRRAHPEIELLVQVMDSRRVLAAVRRREVDLGCVTLSATGRADPLLRVVPIYEDTLICVASPTHPLAGRRPLDLATLAAHPLVLYSRGSHTRASLDQVFRARGVAPNVAMETESPEAMKRLAEVGVGVAILPLAQVRQELAAGSLFRLEPRDAHFTRTLAIVERRGRPLEPAAQRFLSLLLQRWPPLVKSRPEPGSPPGRKSKSRDPSADGPRRRRGTKNRN